MVGIANYELWYILDIVRLTLSLLADGELCCWCCFAQLTVAGECIRMRIPGFLHSLVQPVFRSAYTDGQCSWFAFRVSAAGDTGSRDLLFYYSKEYDPSSLILHLGQCTQEPYAARTRIPRSPPPVSLG